jgi:hypothetical protein
MVASPEGILSLHLVAGRGWFVHYTVLLPCRLSGRSLDTLPVAQVRALQDQAWQAFRDFIPPAAERLARQAFPRASSYFDTVLYQFDAVYAKTGGIL